jgi:hypothetical protein
LQAQRHSRHCARAKALMGLEAFGGFVLLALVITHAVSLLGQ